MITIRTLKVTSLQDHAADAYCRAVSVYLSRRLRKKVEFVDTINWREREQALDGDEVQLAWICGMPYVRRTTRKAPKIELLAAPIYAAARYRQRPIYFSDVVVRAGSAVHRFADLRGGRWAFNDPGSQSGFHTVRHFLATQGYRWHFFDRIVATSAHRRSLQLILDGHVDASALDSTVLDSVLAERPSLAAQIRVIETIGPSPIPPWIIAKRVPSSLRADIRAALLEMHEDDEGGARLRQSGIRRFTAVTDADYAPIREMVKVADAADLQRDDAFLALPNVVTALP